jgi:hypothetical protein
MLGSYVYYSDLLVLCVFRSLMFGFWVPGEKLVFPVYPLSLAHAPRYVWYAVSPLPVLRLAQRHWGLLRSHHPSTWGRPSQWALGQGLFPALRARNYTEWQQLAVYRHVTCAPSLHTAWRMIFGCVCSPLGRRPCVGNFCNSDRKRVLCRRLFPWAHRYICEPQLPVWGGGGEVVRVHAIFRMRLIFTYAAFWTCASPPPLPTSFTALVCSFWTQDHYRVGLRPGNISWKFCLVFLPKFCFEPGRNTLS